MVLLFSWLVRRTGRVTWLGIAKAGAAVAGSVLLIGASIQQLYFLDAPGIGLLGLAWLGAARLAPTRRLTILSVALGVVALVEAVDNSVILLPLPVGPVWIRIVLELTWTVWLGILIVRAQRKPEVATPVQATSQSRSREVEPVAT